MNVPLTTVQAQEVFEGGGSILPPRHLGSLGERCKFPQRGLGQSPATKQLGDIWEPIQTVFHGIRNRVF